MKSKDINKKLIKVTLEYDNEEKRILEGDQCQKWNEELTGMITLGWTHGQTMSEYDWKVEKLTKKFIGDNDVKKS